MVRIEQPDTLDLRSHTVAADKREALLQLFTEARIAGGKLDQEKMIQNGVG